MVIFEAVPFRLVSYIFITSGVNHYKVLVSLRYIPVTVPRPHCILPSLLQGFTFFRYGFSKLFSMGFVSDTLEELYTLLSFQIFEASVVLDKALFIYS